MLSGSHGVALAPLVALALLVAPFKAFKRAFSPCSVLGGVVGGSLAFRGFLGCCCPCGRVCSCLCPFAFMVLGRFRARFRLVLLWGGQE